MYIQSMFTCKINGLRLQTPLAIHSRCAPVASTLLPPFPPPPPQELTLKMEQLQEETVRRRRNLDTETTETLTAQVEYHRVAITIRRQCVDMT